jgi:hypothetical protein
MEIKVRRRFQWAGKNPWDSEHGERNRTEKITISR